MNKEVKFKLNTPYMNLISGAWVFWSALSYLDKYLFDPRLQQSWIPKAELQASQVTPQQLQH